MRSEGRQGLRRLATQRAQQAHPERRPAAQRHQRCRQQHQRSVRTAGHQAIRPDLHGVSGVRKANLGYLRSRRQLQPQASALI